MKMMEKKIRVCDGGVCRRVTVKDFENRWRDLGYKIEGYQEQEIAPDLSSMTKKELIVVIEGMGLAYDKQSNKTKLIAIIMEARGKDV